MLSIREGNGTPLQCSCLENPRDGGAWWAAVYGVAQSGTRLKRLSSSMLSVCKVTTQCCLFYSIIIFNIKIHLLKHLALDLPQQKPE